MRATFVVLAALLAAGCSGASPGHPPEYLFRLAHEQLKAGNFFSSSDTFKKVMNEHPGSPQAPAAAALHIGLAGGLARSYKELAESYQAGSQQKSAAPHARVMRSMAVDYFGRARNRSLEMLEGLDALLGHAAAGPLRVDYPVIITAPRADTLLRIRQGDWVEDKERHAAEKQAFGEHTRGLLDALSQPGRALGEPATVPPARAALTLAEELVEMSSLYRREALDDRRLLRLYHERALGLAERAEKFGAGGAESARLAQVKERCRAILGAGAR